MLDVLNALKLIAAALVGLILLAALMGPIEILLDRMRDLLRSVAQFLVTRFDPLIAAMGDQRQRAFDALGGGEDTWRGWRVVGSTVYFAMLIAFSGAEAGVMALVLEAWGFGTALSFVAENANIFVNLTLLASVAFWGLVLLDVSGTTKLAPLGRTW